MRACRRAVAPLAVLATSAGMLATAACTTAAGAAQVARPAPASTSSLLASVAAYPATGFGGYRWLGAVTSVAATWRVPSIAPGSPPGFAATWIGAQDSRGRAPFFQLGTLEIAVAGGQAEYELFWSDPDVGFHAQRLATLAAGDVVDASMARVPSGWKVDATDETTGADYSTTVAYTAPGSYDEAEWLQEDPTASSVAASDLPYPRTSQITLSGVAVNGAAPTLRLGDGETLMTADGTFLVPSPLVGGTFSFLAPHGAARQYLLDANALDHVISAFDAGFVDWPRTARPDRLAAIATLARAYDEFGKRLAAQRWPPKARRDVALLVVTVDRTTRALDGWAAVGGSTTGPQWRLLRVRESSTRSVVLRASLGLPPA